MNSVRLLPPEITDARLHVRLSIWVLWLTSDFHWSAGCGSHGVWHAHEPARCQLHDGQGAGQRPHHSLGRDFHRLHKPGAPGSGEAFLAICMSLLGPVRWDLPFCRAALSAGQVCGHCQRLDDSVIAFNHISGIGCVGSLMRGGCQTYTAGMSTFSVNEADSSYACEGVRDCEISATAAAAAVAREADTERGAAAGG